MARAPLFRRALPAALLLLPLSAQLARADWPVNGRAICTAPAAQSHPQATSDGAAGAIVAWQDARSAKVNVFAGRVLAAGGLDPAWPINGRALLADSTELGSAVEGQRLPVIAPDGAGGAIVAWQDGRSLLSGADIFAQHILASGVVDPAWPANGIALCTAAGPQEEPVIVSDGAGGAIVAWMDGRNPATDTDVYAQHVLASGAVDPDWPADGTALSQAPGVQFAPRIATDGSGGAFVTWFDLRPDASVTDIYAQHVASSGLIVTGWPADGRAVCLAPQEQIAPAIISDGARGAIIAWEDLRDLTNHIFAQRLLGSGEPAPGWPVDGRAICTAPGDQIAPVLTSDGAGGAIICWQDLRTDHNHNPFAGHVLASGVLDPAWPVNGRALSQSTGEASNASIASDGAGGALVGWEEDSFVLVQHVEGSGALDPTYSVNGRFVKLVLTFQHDPVLVATGLGDAIVAWGDAAFTTDSNILATFATTAKEVDVAGRPPAAAIAFGAPTPNPAREALSLRFALPRETLVRLAIFDATGRRVRVLVSGTRPAGEQSVPWDLRDEGGASVRSGIYFARLDAEGRALTQKFVRVK